MTSGPVATGLVRSVPVHVSHAFSHKGPFLLFLGPCTRCGNILLMFSPSLSNLVMEGSRSVDRTLNGTVLLLFGFCFERGGLSSAFFGTWTLPGRHIVCQKPDSLT